MMTDITTPDALRRHIDGWRKAGQRIGLVPTMGALHDGHLSLVAQLAQTHAQVIVSIFVNPTQFAPHEDFDRYPRDIARDIARLKDSPAALLYTPTADAIYPSGFATRIAMDGPACGLESDSRPHFFSGVALVVAKLLLQCQPDAAIFGEKDYQQLLVIRQLARDLDLPTEIVAAPTIREADGLAMSSRNAYLSAEERQIASQLPIILAELAKTKTDIAKAEQDAAARLRAVGFTEIDYATIRDADTLAPVHAATRARRALIAARLGAHRLIDNMAAAS